MFDPFVSAKPEGVGLGLAVTRQVAEDYGGTLDWQRTDDETQFSLHLPLQAEE
jgi:nitrogen-specific signal transduction histidine kinase